MCDYYSQTVAIYVRKERRKHRLSTKSHSMALLHKISRLCPEKTTCDIVLINNYCRSMCNKSDQIRDYISKSKLDIIALTET